jgi:hypothetical protein
MVLLLLLSGAETSIALLSPTYCVKADDATLKTPVVEFLIIVVPSIFTEISVGVIVLPLVLPSVTVILLSVL